MRPHHHEGARQRFAKIAEQCDMASIFTKAHCGNGGNIVDWLVEDFSIDLSLIPRLGGRSAPLHATWEGKVPKLDGHLRAHTGGGEDWRAKR